MILVHFEDFLTVCTCVLISWLLLSHSIMADKFTPPSIDWTTSGDVYKRFKFFRQKCEFIFEGPLDGVDQKKQVRHLLLWVGDRGLEIYNTTTWADAEDKNKRKEVLDALENYTKPQSNQILSRYQLRCLKQGVFKKVLESDEMWCNWFLNYERSCTNVLECDGWDFWFWSCTITTVLALCYATITDSVLCIPIIQCVNALQFSCPSKWLWR